MRDLRWTNVWFVVWCRCEGRQTSMVNVVGFVNVGRTFGRCERRQISDRNVETDNLKERQSISSCVSTVVSVS